MCINILETKDFSVTHAARALSTYCKRLPHSNKEVQSNYVWFQLDYLHYANTDTHIFNLLQTAANSFTGALLNITKSIAVPT